MSATAPNDSPERIGLIGLGLMGAAFAERFLTGGLAVHGWDVQEARCALLRQLGGAPMTSAATVLDECDRVFLSLPTLEIVATVLQEARAHFRRGHIFIDTTTGDPQRSAELATTLAAHGVTYLDATISGSSEQVRAGDVLVMAGGPREAVERCRDLFALFARETIHTGPSGSGAKLKLVTNLVLGLNRAALAEGLAFARALELDPALALAVLRASAAYSRTMDTKGEKMVRGDFTPQARLSQHLKDVRLILAAAENADAKLPLSETHRALLELAESRGFGDADNSAILRALERGNDE